MVASYDKFMLTRVGSAALHNTPLLFSKHRAMFMRLAASGEVFRINRHNNPPYDKLSLEPSIWRESPH
jgi:hypothetical protein